MAIATTTNQTAPRVYQKEYREYCPARKFCRVIDRSLERISTYLKSLEADLAKYSLDASDFQDSAKLITKELEQIELRVSAAERLKLRDQFTVNNRSQLESFVTNDLQRLITTTHRITKIENSGEFFQTTLESRLKALRESLKSITPTEAEIKARNAKPKKEEVEEKPVIVTETTIQAISRPDHELIEELKLLARLVARATKPISQETGSYEVKTYERTLLDANQIAHQVSDPVKRSALLLLASALKKDTPATQTQQNVVFINTEEARNTLNEIEHKIQALVQNDKFNIGTIDLRLLDILEDALMKTREELQSISTANEKDFPLKAWDSIHMDVPNKIGLVRSKNPALSVALRMADEEIEKLNNSHHPVCIFQAFQRTVKDSHLRLGNQIDSIVEAIVKRRDLLTSRRRAAIGASTTNTSGNKTIEELLRVKAFQTSLKNAGHTTVEKLSHQLQEWVKKAKESGIEFTSRVADLIHQARTEFLKITKPDQASTFDVAAKLALLSRAAVPVNDRLAKLSDALIYGKAKKPISEDPFLQKFTAA